jgi:hypothetical protein
MMSTKNKYNFSEINKFPSIIIIIIIIYNDCHYYISDSFTHS